MKIESSTLPIIVHSKKIEADARKFTRFPKKARSAVELGWAGLPSLVLCTSVFFLYNNKKCPSFHFVTCHIQHKLLALFSFQLKILALMGIVLLFGDHHAVETTSQLVETASKFFFLYLGGPRKISLQTHSNCPPPRKSLVKGKRFIRVEGKPELGALVKTRR